MTVNKTTDLSPILSPEFDAWMYSIGYFEQNPIIAVAVSGGSDSMALLLLLKKWVHTQNGKVVALTVNHNLRPEAINEAIQVKQWCKEHNIEHHTLHWQHSSPQVSAIQANARKARYQLMIDWCLKNSVLHLLTAHHRDDQTETLFFRLARGSKLEGLSAMSAQTIVSGVRLLRPLLQTTKQRLINTLKIFNQEWLEDPSNQNLLYTRVHIRNQLAKITNYGNINQAASCITNKLGKFRNLLENKLASELTNAIEISQYGYAVINLCNFKKLDKEISIKAISALIQTISGSQHPPRYEKLTYLYNAISTNQLRSKQNLGGVLFKIIAGQQILVYREAHAIEKPRLIPANTSILWDKRFIIKWSQNNNCLPSLELRTLDIETITKIKDHLPKNAPPTDILYTIPSLWLLEEVISIPHIGYMNKHQELPPIKSNIQFYPAKSLAGNSFFVMNNLL